MIKFIARRILHTIPLLLVMTIVIFILVDAMPGDELTAYINSIPEGEPRPSYEQIQQMRLVLELDKPWHIRYFEWLGKALKGDFGVSLHYRKPATEVVSVLVWHTFMINSVALLLTFLISIPIGVRSAARKNGIFAPCNFYLNAYSYFIAIFFYRALSHAAHGSKTCYCSCNWHAFRYFTC